MVTTDASRVLAVAPGEGQAWWWTGELAEIKLRAEDTEGRFSLVEVTAPPGIEIPRHVHHGEDETFYVLEGSVTFEVSGSVVEAEAGAVLFAPRDVPHAYTVGPEGARVLFLFSPGGFEGFIEASGEPARARTVPPADVVTDMGRLEAALGEYRAEMVG